MNMRSLRTLRRLRQEAADDAARLLAACIEAEAAATAAVRRQAGEIDRQRREAEAMHGTDADVEAFGQWFRRARQQLVQLVAGQERAMAESARARAGLTAARSARETVETLLREAARAETAAMLRAEQKIADDMASQRRGGAGRGEPPGPRHKP